MQILLIWSGPKGKLPRCVARTGAEANGPGTPTGTMRSGNGLGRYGAGMRPALHGGGLAPGATTDRHPHPALQRDAADRRRSGRRGDHWPRDVTRTRRWQR